MIFGFFAISDHHLEILLRGWDPPQVDRVGVIEGAGPDATRRFNDDVQWLPAGPKTVLYDGDHVFSGANEEIIHLADGSVLQLLPGSLVILQKDGREDLLDILSGGVLGTLGGERRFLVRLDGQLSEIRSPREGSRIELGYSNGHQARIRPLGEDPISVTPLTEPQDLPLSEIQARVEPPPQIAAVEPLSPPDLSRFQLGLLDSDSPPGSGSGERPRNGHGLDVILEWRRAPFASGYELELSPDRAFAAESPRKVSDGAQYRVAGLWPGTYFWRVRGVAEGTAGPWSRISAFSIESTHLPVAGAPRPLLPRQGQEVTLDGDSTRIRFEWERKSGAIGYVIEIARGSSFSPSSLVARDRVRGTELARDLSVSGTLFWRVRAVLKSGEVTEFSSPRKVRVLILRPKIRDKKLEFEGAAVRPGSLQGSRFGELRCFAGIADAVVAEAARWIIPSAGAAETRQVSQPAGPLLRWDPVAGSKEYRVEISNSMDFRKILFIQLTSSDSLVWPGPPPGNYYWRVIAYDEDGVAGQPSNPAIIEVRVPPPMLRVTGVEARGSFPGEERRFEHPPVRLDWTAVKDAASFEVQLSRDAQFSAPVIRRIPGLSDQPRRSNWRFARVRALARDGNPISRFSNTVEVHFPEPPRALPAVVSAHPWQPPSLNVALGFTSLHYQDSGGTVYSSTVMSLGFEYVRPLVGDSLALRVQGDFLFLPLPQSLASPGLGAGATSSLGTFSASAPRFLNMGAFASWRTPWFPRQWILSLDAGATYSTMIAKPLLFGYQDVWGPALFPSIRRTFGGGESALAYVRFSPVISSQPAISGSSHQFVAGGAWTWPLGDFHEWTVGADYSALQLLASGSQSGSMESTEIYFSFGL